MRGIARKDHAAVKEFLHPAALEFVQGYPLELELLVPEHPLDPRPHVFRPLFRYRIRIRIQLQIDTPDIVRLFMQKRGAPGVKWWIEPEPALGRKICHHSDVRDQKLIFKYFPGELRPDHLPQRR